MAERRLLVVDRNPELHEFVSGIFQARGYDVMVTDHGEEALELARASSPDMIMVEMELHGMTGPGLVRSLRAHPRFGFIPVIFFADRAAVQERVRGFSLGADRYLPKPFSEGDIERIVSESVEEHTQTIKMVRKTEPTGEALGFSSALETFRGSLEQMGVATLLGMMEMEQRTGELVLIIQPENEKVRIHIKTGRIVRASHDRKPELKNRELVMDVVGRSRGKFDFRPQAIVFQDEVNVGTSTLLREAARRIEEQIG